MHMEYRVAKQSDIQGIFTLFQELKEEDAQVGFTRIKEPVEIQLWLDDEHFYLYVATDPEENTIIGVLRGKRGVSNKAHSVFLTAAIAKGWRGKNIGKKLTQFGLAELKNKGLKIARTYVYSNNKASINTLLSCGFTISGTVYMHHFSDETQQYVDDIIVHKVLNS